MDLIGLHSRGVLLSGGPQAALLCVASNQTSPLLARNLVRALSQMHSSCSAAASGAKSEKQAGGPSSRFSDAEMNQAVTCFVLR